MDLAQQWQYTTQPIDCAPKSTIWSQPSQSYSHVVDFSGESLSLMPVGHSERRDSPWILSEASLWEEGGFKPAPLDDVAIDAITISEESLVYIQ